MQTAKNQKRFSGICNSSAPFRLEMKFVNQMITHSAWVNWGIWQENRRPTCEKSEASSKGKANRKWFDRLDPAHFLLESSWSSTWSRLCFRTPRRALPGHWTGCILLEKSNSFSKLSNFWSNKWQLSRIIIRHSSQSKRNSGQGSYQESGTVRLPTINWTDQAGSSMKALRLVDRLDPGQWQ